MMNVISTFIGKQHYCHHEKRIVNIEQPNIIKQCNMSKGWGGWGGGGGVDCMNQNISAYMINLRTKKWWWPLFQFVVDVTVYNVYQIYRLSHLNKNLISNHLEFLNSIMDDFSKSYRVIAMTSS